MQIVGPLFYKRTYFYIHTEETLAINSSAFKNNYKKMHFFFSVIVHPVSASNFVCKKYIIFNDRFLKPNVHLQYRHARLIYHTAIEPATFGNLAHCSTTELPVTLHKRVQESRVYGVRVPGHQVDP